MASKAIWLLLLCASYAECALDTSASVLFVQKDQGALQFQDESATGTHVGMWVDETGELGVNAPVVLLDGLSAGQLKINGTDIESFFATAQASLAPLEALAAKPWTVELRQALLAVAFSTGDSTVSKPLSDRADEQLGGTNSNGWFNFYAAQFNAEGLGDVQPLTFNSAGHTNPLDSRHNTNSGVFSRQTNQYFRPALGAQRVLDQENPYGQPLRTANNEVENEICVVPAYPYWTDYGEDFTAVVIRWNPVRAQGGFVQFRGHIRGIGDVSGLAMKIVYLGRFYAGDYGQDSDNGSGDSGGGSGGNNGDNGGGSGGNNGDGGGSDGGGDGSGGSGGGGNEKAALLYESVGDPESPFSFVLRVHYTDNFLFVIPEGQDVGSTGALRVAMSRVVPSAFGDLRWNFDQVQAIRHGLVTIGMSADGRKPQLPDWFLSANGSDAARAKCARIGSTPQTRPDCGSDMASMGWLAEEAEELIIHLPTPMALSHYMIKGTQTDGVNLRSFVVWSQTGGFALDVDQRNIYDITVDGTEPAQPAEFDDGVDPKACFTSRLTISMPYGSGPARLEFEFGLSNLMPFAAWGTMSLWNFWAVYEWQSQAVASWPLKMLTENEVVGWNIRFANTFVPDVAAGINVDALPSVHLPVEVPVVGNKQLETLVDSLSYMPRPDELVVELGRRDNNDSPDGVRTWLRWSAGEGDWNKQVRFNITVRHLVPRVNCSDVNQGPSAECVIGWCVDGACTRPGPINNLYPPVKILVTHSMQNSATNSAEVIQVIDLDGGGDPGSVFASGQVSLVPDAVNRPHGPGISFVFLPVPLHDSWATVGVTLSIY